MMILYAKHPKTLPGGELFRSSPVCIYFSNTGTTMKTAIKENTYSIVWKNNPDFRSGFWDLGFCLVGCSRFVADLGGHIWRIVGEMLEGFSHCFGGVLGGLLKDF